MCKVDFLFPYSLPRIRNYRSVSGFEIIAFEYLLSPKLLVQLEQLNYLATERPQYRHLFMNTIMESTNVRVPFLNNFLPSYRLYLHPESPLFRSSSSRRLLFTSIRLSIRLTNYLGSFPRGNDQIKREKIATSSQFIVDNR